MLFRSDLKRIALWEMRPSSIIILAGELLTQAKNPCTRVRSEQTASGRVGGRFLHHSALLREQLLVLISTWSHPAISTTTIPTPPTLPTLTGALNPALAAKQFGSENILAALVADSGGGIGCRLGRRSFVLIMSGALQVFFDPFWFGRQDCWSK